MTEEEIQRRVDENMAKHKNLEHLPIDLVLSEELRQHNKRHYDLLNERGEPMSAKELAELGCRSAATGSDLSDLEDPALGSAG